MRRIKAKCSFIRAFIFIVFNIYIYCVYCFEMVGVEPFTISMNGSMNSWCGSEGTFLNI